MKDLLKVQNLVESGLLSTAPHQYSISYEGAGVNFRLWHKISGKPTHFFKQNDISRYENFDTAIVRAPCG